MNISEELIEDIIRIVRRNVCKKNTSEEVKQILLTVAKRELKELLERELTK